MVTLVWIEVEAKTPKEAEKEISEVFGEMWMQPLRWAFPGIMREQLPPGVEFYKKREPGHGR